VNSLQLQLIEEGIKTFTNDLPETPAHLYDPIRYTMNLGGKRMRPVLVLSGASLFTDDLQSALPAAVGIELFHNFTLLHDDIMDLAPLRRGQPTVYKKWNSNIAILSGDAMFAESLRLMAKSPHNALPRILESFTKAALEVCEGQQMDMDFEQQARVTIPEYIRMIELKTAVLLAASLEIGAYCGGAYSTDAHKLYEFGRNIGIAFQLQDDILDVYGDPEKFGKQVGGDIVSNKKTYLLISALQQADGYLKEELLNWLQAGADQAVEKVSSVKEIYNRLHIREQAEAEMKKYYDVAMQSLLSVGADEQKLAGIRAFADALMVREQ